MAKALLGYIGGTDVRLLQEARQLRLRVADLERQMTRLQIENDSLRAALDERRLFHEEPQPAPADLTPALT